ncbi:hypothetical protein Q7C36_002457 [Tachysurus vachellii]|uniref:C1q domain-containing protein n=1 Tax=Tachysurus vachellii TaxID=175792 RepID=A0AA88NW62_TACVA|nr:uncharacterized protein LOC132859601 [Tachysurus vachellii]KAK2866401.1 hypothetical protein Q7C36_002457 [Tachysurus vachellii]
MGVSSIQLLSVLLVCATNAKQTEGSCALKMQRNEDQALREQLTFIYKEVEGLRNDQNLMKQKQEDMMQAVSHCTEIQPQAEKEVNVTSLGKGSTSTLEEEDDTDEGFDPCKKYSSLNQNWRATNYSTKNVACDRNTQWNGWYRLFYRGRSIQMPELCVKTESCGTHSPLWLSGGHPRKRDGIVTRKVCGNWNGNCCAFKSPPIQVKACQGNYYVYKFVKPPACHLAYCADVNTLICGKCKKYEICTSKDKIKWFCKKSKRRVKANVHFFAAYPGSLSGKVNRIQYRKVYVNVGGAYSSRTGVFTAPVTGVYQFFFSSQADSSGLITNLWLVVNGYWAAVSHTHVGVSNTVGNLSTYMTTLRKGALVYVTQSCGKSWADSAFNSIVFGGSLLFVQR